MSYRITSLVVRGYTGPRWALPVLMALADYADDKGIAWPSVASIGTRARLSERRVREHLATLERDRWIRPTGSRSGGRALTVRWCINVEKLRNPDAGGTHSDPLNPAADRRVSEPETDAETLRPAAVNPATHRRKPCGRPQGKQLEATKKRSERGERRAERAPDRGSKRPRALSLREALELDPELQHRCLTEAAALRPDLTAEQIATSWENFADKAQAQDRKAKDWSAEWRPWIRRENVAKLTDSQRKAANIDELCGHNKPMHASHRYFDAASDPFARPNGNVYDATATTVETPADDDDGRIPIPDHVKAQLTDIIRAKAVFSLTPRPTPPDPDEDA